VSKGGGGRRFHGIFSLKLGDFYGDLAKKTSGSLALTSQA
jgi:hypothetical protein